MELTFPSWWGWGGGDDVVCVSGVHTNHENTEPFFSWKLKTLDPSGRSAQTHKTSAFSKKIYFHVDGALAMRGQIGVTDRRQTRMSSVTIPLPSCFLHEGNNWVKEKWNSVDNVGAAGGAWICGWYSSPFTYTDTHAREDWQTFTNCNKTWSHSQYNKNTTKWWRFTPKPETPSSWTALP